MDALLDSAVERAESDPSIALCEVGAAILVLAEFKNAIKDIAEDAVAEGTATLRAKNFVALGKRD